MKKIIYILISFLCFSCESPYDCFDLSTGNLTIQEAIGYKTDGPYMAVTAGSKLYNAYSSSSLLYDGNNYGANGNGNGAVNPGETVIYSIKVANYGKKPALNVLANISTSDEYIIDIQNTSGNIGSFAERKEIVSTDSETTVSTVSTDSKTIFSLNHQDNLMFTVSPYTPKGHLLKFQIVFTDTEGNRWEDYFLVMVN